MTPEAALRQAKKGELLPFYVVIGDEQLLRDEVVLALREAALGGAIAAFNEDRFTAGEGDVERVVAAARTAPMMAARRFVYVRALERWDSAREAADRADDSRERAGSPLDRLAEYAAAPVPSTCLVLAGSRLDGRRKLAAVAKKQGLFVGCDPIDGAELVAWIEQRSERRGAPIEREVAELLAQLAGPDLSTVQDALERLALYVGEGQPITEAAVATCVARVRTADTWALVDAVGARDLGKALRTLADVYEPRDRGLPLLGALAWSVRQLARYQAARAAGSGPDEAARRAGAFQPWKARELATKARAVQPQEVERWLLVLAETDVALKSSRRPADAILEDMITRLCRKAA